MNGQVSFILESDKRSKKADMQKILCYRPASYI